MWGWLCGGVLLLQLASHDSNYCGKMCFWGNVDCKNPRQIFSGGPGNQDLIWKEKEFVTSVIQISALLY